MSTSLTTSNTSNPSSTTPADQVEPSAPAVQQSQCSYHNPILTLTHFPINDTRGQDVMTRFLNEGSSEQHAVFIRPDNGRVSVSKGCTCSEKVDKSASKL